MKSFLQFIKENEKSKENKTIEIGAELELKCTTEEMVFAIHPFIPLKGMMNRELFPDKEIKAFHIFRPEEFKVLRTLIKEHTSLAAVINRFVDTIPEITQGNESIDGTMVVSLEGLIKIAASVRSIMRQDESRKLWLDPLNLVKNDISKKEYITSIIKKINIIKEKLFAKHITSNQDMCIDVEKTIRFNILKAPPNEQWGVWQGLKSLEMYNKSEFFQDNVKKAFMADYLIAVETIVKTEKQDFQKVFLNFKEDDFSTWSELLVNGLKITEVFLIMGDETKIPQVNDNLKKWAKEYGKYYKHQIVYNKNKEAFFKGQMSKSKGILLNTKK